MLDLDPHRHIIAKIDFYHGGNWFLPLDAIVERIKQDNVEVVWMEGGYKSWRVAKQLDPKNRRKKFDGKDIVPKSSIILFDFKATSNNHLTKLTVDRLKKAYLELKQSN